MGKIKKYQFFIFFLMALFFCDVFVWNQTLGSSLILTYILFRFIFSKSENRPKKVIPLGIIIISHALTIGANSLQNTYAEYRGNEVVKAINKFREDNNRFPKTLQELTPKYIPSIPLAKFSIMGNQFQYGAEPDHYWMIYNHPYPQYNFYYFWYPVTRGTNMYYFAPLEECGVGWSRSGACPL